MESRNPARFAFIGSICGFLCLLLAIGCPQTIPPFNGGSLIGGTSDYVGADVCQRCHTEIHAVWKDSHHARALDSLRATGDQYNPSCLPCHSTGYGNRGFVSENLTPGMANVQCESCHGPAAKHVGTRNPADIVRVPLTSVCGTCHTGEMQPNYDEWRESGHASALQTVRDDPTRRDECLVCHSYDYVLAVKRNEIRALRGLQPMPLPSITDADASNDPKESVGCSLCHAPHGSPFQKSLRLDVPELCSTCHSDFAIVGGSRLPPGAGLGPPGAEAINIAPIPHAPQTNFLAGLGGRRLSDAAESQLELFASPPSVHATLGDSGGCVRCHGIKIHVDKPTPQMPNQTGHRFEIFLDACTPCHTQDEVQARLPARQAEISARLTGLRQRAAAFNPAALSKFQQSELEAATFDLDLIDTDGSGGIHSVPHATALLDAADQLLSDIEQ